jgi:hypothetical protein
MMKGESVRDIILLVNKDRVRRGKNQPRISAIMRNGPILSPSKGEESGCTDRIRAAPRIFTLVSRGGIEWLRRRKVWLTTVTGIMRNTIYGSRHFWISNSAKGAAGGSSLAASLSLL